MDVEVTPEGCTCNFSYCIGDEVYVDFVDRSCKFSVNVYYGEVKEIISDPIPSYRIYFSEDGEEHWLNEIQFLARHDGQIVPTLYHLIFNIFFHFIEIYILVSCFFFM